jgi:hypothetical protein
MSNTRADGRQEGRFGTRAPNLPFKESYLDTVKELKATYDRLRK